MNQGSADRTAAAQSVVDKDMDRDPTRNALMMYVMDEQSRQRVRDGDSARYLSNYMQQRSSDRWNDAIADRIFGGAGVAAGGVISAMGEPLFGIPLMGLGAAGWNRGTQGLQESSALQEGADMWRKDPFRR